MLLISLILLLVASVLGNILQFRFAQDMSEELVHWKSVADKLHTEKLGNFSRNYD